MHGTMPPMRRTRHPARLLQARLLLVCFALALGAAMLSPLVRAQGMERICNAAGEPRWVAAGGNDAAAQDAQQHGLECVLCLPAMLPPPAIEAPGAAQALPPHVPAALAPSHVPPLSRAAFPPRAPPARA